MMNEGQFFGANVVFWIGVVEERDDQKSKDGKQLGRVQVRIYGHHSAQKEEDNETGEGIPTEKLHWAYPVMPVNMASASGIGQSPTGIVEGSTVVGFSMDGEMMQDLYIIGTIGGVISKFGNPKKGFNDPYGRIPRLPYGGEEDTNRLARVEHVDQTIVNSKNEKRQIDVRTALDGKFWGEPESAYKAKYPYNHVYESESGHIDEIDDTEGEERRHTYHKKGNYVEIDKNGNEVHKIMGNHFIIHMGDNRRLTVGDENVVIEGDFNIRVNGDCKMEYNGDLTREIHGNLTEIVDGDHITYVKNNHRIIVDGESIAQFADNRYIRNYGDVEEYTYNDYTNLVHGGFHLAGASEIKVSSAGDVQIAAGKNIDTSGTLIHLNTNKIEADIVATPATVKPPDNLSDGSFMLWSHPADEVGNNVAEQKPLTNDSLTFTPKAPSGTNKPSGGSSSSSTTTVGTSQNGTQFGGGQVVSRSTGYGVSYFQSYDFRQITPIDGHVERTSTKWDDNGQLWVTYYMDDGSKITFPYIDKWEDDREQKIRDIIIEDGGENAEGDLSGFGITTTTSKDFTSAEETTKLTATEDEEEEPYVNWLRRAPR